MAEYEERIASWRHTLAQAGLSGEVIEELETHLREELARLEQAGHGADEAFALAESRLGQPAALGAEFARAAPNRLFTWLPVGVARIGLLLLCVGLIVVLARLLVVGRMSPLLACHVAAVTVGYSATLVAGALAVCYVVTRSFRDLTPMKLHALGREVFVLTFVAAVLTAVGLVLGCVWAGQNLGSWWQGDPREIGALVVLIWNVLLIVAHGRNLLDERALALLCLTNLVLTGCAWFGTVAAQHAYGISSLFLALFLGVLAQSLLFALGLAPAGCLRRRRSM